MSGTIWIRARASPFFTWSPASTYSSRTIPLTTGLIRISLRGTMLPLATVFLMMVAFFGFSTVNSSGLVTLFW